MIQNVATGDYITFKRFAGVTSSEVVNCVLFPESLAESIAVTVRLISFLVLRTALILAPLRSSRRTGPSSPEAGSVRRHSGTLTLGIMLSLWSAYFFASLSAPPPRLISLRSPLAGLVRVREQRGRRDRVGQIHLVPSPQGKGELDKYWSTEVDSGRACWVGGAGVDERAVLHVGPVLCDAKWEHADSQVSFLESPRIILRTK